MSKFTTFTAAFLAMAAMPGAAFAGHLTDANVSAPNSAAEVNDNAAPIAKERAERNSAGGDREKGAFGQAQSDYVTSLPEGTSYGQILKEGGWTGSSK
jgi:hypothetical protein